MNRSTSVFIDASRWIAALLVVISHLRSTIFVDYPLIAAPTKLLEAIYFVCGFGPVAVIVFFVISGYLVGGRMLLRSRSRHISLLDYASHRIARIYVVLLPALITGYAFDWVGCRYFNQSGIYSGFLALNMTSLNYNVGLRLDIPTLLGNAAMLQTILVPPLGSNGPLWSLANEWWYYVLFGLLLAATLRRLHTVRLAAALAAVLIMAALPAAITFWFLIWSVGIGVALLEQRWRGPHPAAALAIFFLVCSLTRLHHHPVGIGRLGIVGDELFYDLAVSLAYGGTMLGANRLGFSSAAQLHAKLAAFSYSTYLVHFPVMLLALAAADRYLGIPFVMQPAAAGFLLSGCVLALIYAYAWGFARLTENYTDLVRRALLGMIRRLHPIFRSSTARL